MPKIVSPEEIRQIEADSGIEVNELIGRAAQAVVDHVRSLIRYRPDSRITILVGPGTNGSDGLAIGRHLALVGGAQIRFYLLRRRDENDPMIQSILEAKLAVAVAEDDQRYRVLHNLIASAHVIIDALFGIGVRLPIEGDAAKLLQQVHRMLKEIADADYPRLIAPAHPAPVTPKPTIVAVDCPSGVDGATGAADPLTLPADDTVTFIAVKPGFLQFPAADYIGRLHVAQLAIPDRAFKTESPTLLDTHQVSAMLPKRSANSHKGTYGRALLVAGSINYAGAAALASQGAYRAGTGLVTVAAPQPVVAVLAAQLQEPTWMMLPHDLGVIGESAHTQVRQEFGKVDALLLGPGWGTEETTERFLLNLLQASVANRKKRSLGFRVVDSETADESAVNSDQPPMVIDADALNLLARTERWWTLLPKNTILTPHPGEMARLTGLETQQVQQNRIALAREKAAEWNVVLVLKGAHTVIADPQGRVTVLPFKTDALAKAGTGDVLAGIITGLLAQQVAPFEAAAAGAYIHGLAGQRAAERIGSGRSVTASDVAQSVGEAFARIER